MRVEFGPGATKYGPGVLVTLDGDELAKAVDTYLVAHDIIVSGARTIRVRGELCGPTTIYVDPSGFVIDHNTGVKYSGRGPND